MEDFDLFTPGVIPDPLEGKISRLTTRNFYLTVGILVTISLAVYFAYEYYSVKKDKTG